MAKASSIAELSELHKLITKSLVQRIEADIEDNIPTDAATLGAAIKFLKDNAVTADPADQDDLTALRDKLKEQSETRRKRVNDVLTLVQSDLNVMQG